MKREIDCRDCGGEWRGKGKSPYDSNGKRRRIHPADKIVKLPHNERMIVRHGFLKREDCRCDHCGKPLVVGGIVAAVTVWSMNHGIPYAPWETSYIDVVTDEKVIDGHDRLDG